MGIMRWRTSFIIGVCLALGMGCSKEKPGRSVFVVCGAAMKNPMEEIGALFERKTGIRVEYTYAGSACLLPQVDGTGQGDVYMPGEMFYLDQARKRGLVSRYERVLYMVPVIVVAKGNPKGIRGLQDLAREGLRVGLGDPKTTALGKHSHILLKRAGLLERVLRNMKTSAVTAPELGNAIKLAHIDAAIIWDCLAHWYPDDLDTIRVPVQGAEISTVPLAVLRSARDQDAAGRFLDFVSSAEGKAVFRKHHYTLDLPPPLAAGILPGS